MGLGLLMTEGTSCGITFSRLAGAGAGTGVSAHSFCLVFLGQEQCQQDERVAKALDMAMILDYWGREPGEMVMRINGHKGEITPFNQ